MKDIALSAAVCSRVTSATFVILLIVFVWMFTGSACHAAPPVETKPLALSQFVAGIVTRSSGLNYVTEQDSEVFVFYRNTPVEELTDSVFLTLLRRPSGTQIASQSWSMFFERRTRNDPTGKWEELQEYLEANLTNRTVFLLPRDDPYGAQYDLYAVGIFGGDTVVGVQMFGVAT